MPSGTKSLALQVYDSDAPTGSGFWPWAIYDIPPSASGLARGVGNNATLLPAGAFGGNTDFLDTGATGVNGNYGGPCPPAGDPPHRYIFTLFALAADKVEVAGGVRKTGTAGLYGFVLNKGIGANLLGKASFTATYGRQEIPSPARRARLAHLEAFERNRVLGLLLVVTDARLRRVVPG